jgi:hypothetical protein
MFINHFNLLFYYILWIGTVEKEVLRRIFGLTEKAMTGGWIQLHNEKTRN